MNGEVEKVIFRADGVTAEISDRRYLKEISWQINRGEFWAVLGTNASGKSALGKLLTGRLKVVSGELAVEPSDTGYVSFEKHNEMMEDLLRNDETDFIDRIDTGTLVKDFICSKETPAARRALYTRDRKKSANSDSSCDQALCRRAEELASGFGISHLMERGIRFLSTGETRKTMICQALVHSPSLLVLDEPYDGVDVASRKAVSDAVTSLGREDIAVVMILNRFSEIPEEATHILYISDCMVQLMGKRNEILGSRDKGGQSALERLHNLHHTLPETLPEKYITLRNRREEPELRPSAGDALVKMVDTTVIYGERRVLDSVSWEVKAGEHWKISGPNGAGKSTLLSLINGDNPQAYCNHIELFGRRRGTGESIWEIKKNTGMVSSAFQTDYRVSSSVLAVVVSGFFDSIGVYRNPAERQKEIALEWLKVIDMEKSAKKPFRSLSYGEQRMVLIARAMVKHPPLLILDEPCQGLDEVNRRMVLKLIDHIGRSGESTLLYVTHHDEDHIGCINRSFQFVPDGSGSMKVQIS